MDLGIAGKKGIVCASSKGLGKACALSLAREGVDVTICARSEATLQETATEINEIGSGKVTFVVCDITTEKGQKLVLEACNEPDILVNNAGGPPPGDFRNWERDDWIKAVDGNMLTPIFMIKATLDGMIDRKFGRIINITSSAVKAPIDILGLSNGARAGLTGFVAGLARKTVRHNVTINNILPGPFETDRLRENLRVAAKNMGRDEVDVANERREQNPAGRFGYPEEFGELCAFISSMQASYITGQNFLIDGGSYPGTL